MPVAILFMFFYVYSYILYDYAPEAVIYANIVFLLSLAWEIYKNHRKNNKR